MARRRLIRGLGDNLIWDAVLCCDNDECEYHKECQRAEIE